MISCTLVKHDSRSRSSITSILRVTLLTKHLGDEKLLFTVHYFVWKIYGNGEMPSILRSGFFLSNVQDNLLLTQYILFNTSKDTEIEGFLSN